MDPPCPPHYSYVGNFTPPCLPTCPYEYYSKSEYDVLLWTHVVLPTIAILTAIFALFPYIFIVERRRWPGPLLIAIFVCIIGVGIGGLLPVIVHGKDHWYRMSCKTKTQLADYYDLDCTIDALFNYGCAIYASSLWMCIAVNLFLKSIHVQKIIKYEISTTLQSAVSFGYCTLVTGIGCIIMLATHGIQGNPANGGGCFVDPSMDDGWLYDGLFTTIVFVNFGIGTFCVLATIGIFVAYGQGCGTLITFCRRQWRIFLFLAIYWYAAGANNFYRVGWLRGATPRIEKSVAVWYMCLYQSWGMSLATNSTLAEANAYAKQVCSRPYVPSFGPLLWVSLSILCAAAIFPLVFACDSTIMKWWWDVGHGKRPSTISLTMTESNSGEVKSMSPRGT